MRVCRSEQARVTGEDSTGLGDKANLIRIAKCPGKDYTASLQKNFEGSTSDQEHEFLESLGADAGMRVLASPMIATSVARVDGKPHVFFANFAGLRGGVNPVQTPQTDVQVTVAATTQHHGFFLRSSEKYSQWRGPPAQSVSHSNCPQLRRGQCFGMSRDNNRAGNRDL